MTTRMTLEPERDATLESLQEALAVLPSATLAAQIRQRVRVEPMRSAHVAWWRPALAALSLSKGAPFVRRRFPARRLGRDRSRPVRLIGGQ